jgi:hypothetical protein
MVFELGGRCLAVYEEEGYEKSQIKRSFGVGMQIWISNIYSIKKQQVVLFSAKIVSDAVGDRFREPHPALQSDRAPPTAKVLLH